MPAGGQRDGQRAFDRADFAGESEFAHDPILVEIPQRHLVRRRDDAERHGQVEARALLLHIGRREVEDDSAIGILERAIV